MLRCVFYMFVVFWFLLFLCFCVFVLCVFVLLLFVAFVVSCFLSLACICMFLIRVLFFISLSHFCFLVFLHCRFFYWSASRISICSGFSKYYVFFFCDFKLLFTHHANILIKLSPVFICCYRISTCCCYSVFLCLCFVSFPFFRVFDFPNPIPSHSCIFACAPFLAFFAFTISSLHLLANQYCYWIWFLLFTHCCVFCFL